MSPRRDELRDGNGESRHRRTMPARSPPCVRLSGQSCADDGALRHRPARAACRREACRARPRGAPTHETKAAHATPGEGRGPAAPPRRLLPGAAALGLPRASSARRAQLARRRPRRLVRRQGLGAAGGSGKCLRHVSKREFTRCAYHSVVRRRLIFGPCSSMRGTIARGSGCPAFFSASANTRE